MLEQKIVTVLEKRVIYWQGMLKLLEVCRNWYTSMLDIDREVGRSWGSSVFQQILHDHILILLKLLYLTHLGHTVCGIFGWDRNRCSKDSHCENMGYPI